MKPLKLHPLWYLTSAAIALRLVLFLGRGDYVAFDEGWYLVLGRNLMSGSGYTLSGLQHVALSPLFPILSGLVGEIVENPVWAGRIVAAVTGGALVIPCWYLFLRLGGRTTAWIGCILVACMPSLAPFVAPYWIGWDLWVGAEPVLHLFLYAGLALALRALDSDRLLEWALAGFALGLAYLARPEAVITFGILAVAVMPLAVLERRVRPAAGAVLLALGFALAAAPYAIYLHDVLGHWTLTGRVVAVSSSLQSAVPRSGVPAQTRLVEDMLWRDEKTYVRDLYALDATGTRLADSYWGLPDHASSGPQAQPIAPPAIVPSSAKTATDSARPAAQPAAVGPKSTTLYARALIAIVPLYLLPLIILGLLPRRSASWSRELAFALPLLGTSVLIAVAIAADPRTQLLIVPLAAFYAARGIHRAGTYIELRAGDSRLRRGMMQGALATVVVLLLLGTEARWLYFSLALGSPHHLVGAENRRIAEALQHTVPRAAPIMSYHPALALYARRDWRVLPQAEFKSVLRYANAIASEYIVLSPYYPTPLRVADNDRDYVLLHVPPGSAGVEHWQFQAADETRPYLSLTPGRKDER